MAGAVWRTLGAFSVPSICLEEAGLTSCGGKKKKKKRGGAESQLDKVNVPHAIAFPSAHI